MYFERLFGKHLTLFGPGKIFWLMAQGGIDSTQHIQTPINVQQKNL